MDRTDDLEVYFRENGSCLQVMGNQIYISDIDRFTMSPNASGLFDLGELPAREDGKELIRSLSLQSVKGEWSIFDLDKYGLQLIWRDNECYIPVQVFSDLIVSELYVNLVYNDKLMIAMPYLGFKEDPNDPAKSNLLSDLGKLFYDCEPHTKTPAHSQFTYNALCIALDANYGLMSEHGIDDFDDLLSRSDAVVLMMSGDPMNTLLALHQLTLINFADSHSVCVSTQMPGGSGSLNDMESDVSKTYLALVFSLMPGEIGQKLMQGIDYSNASDKFYPDGPIGYEEVDDTAFITFDAFVFDTERDYYNTEITNNPKDTMELLLYAYRQITREDSPVKNVVLDLSINGGGMATMAVAASAWMIGKSCISAENVKNGAFGTVFYCGDFNLDGVPDYQESMKSLGLNLFCLIGPNSFSCGNLVPAVLKSSNHVTMIGRNSGGGACVVRPLTTADGAFFTVSGPTRLVTTLNGSRTSVEHGTEPDVYIRDISRLYDRPGMVSLIHELP